MNANLLKNKTYSLLKSRRQRANAKLDDLIDELCLDDGFKNAYYTERALELELVKAKYQNKGVKQIQTKLNNAIKKTDEALSRLGKTRQDLLVKYFCEICQDTGKVDGKTCNCVKVLQTELAYDGRQSTARFEFSQAEITEENKSIITNAQKWCEDYPNVNKRNYFICGHTGVGKTYLSECMVNALKKRSVDVVYMTAYNLNKAFFDDFMAQDKYLLDSLIDAEVIVVDDLGKEPIYNKISLESWYSLLNERTNRGKTTIINTNLEPQEILNKYGEPIFSRIVNKQTVIVELVGKDKRNKANNA
ncbi:MAG: ATP-binding protein [Clostridia bacterium]|nr:ATP-binding protein [Clostridia bacterium]